MHWRNFLGWLVVAIAVVGMSPVLAHFHANMLAAGALACGAGESPAILIASS